MVTASTPRKSAAGREYAPMTRKLIALKPGRRLLVTSDPLTIDRERGNMASRIRTATLRTGRRFTMSTENGRLYVACVAVVED